MIFSDWIQEKILESGKTRKEVAKLAGIPKNKMDDFCNGVCPSSYQTTLLSKALNISIDEFEGVIGGKELHLGPVRKHNTKIDKTIFNKQTRNIHRTPLQPIIENTCVLTGDPNPERAHYDGPAQHLFGKGMSEKCDNLFVAEISHEKHMEFHDPKTRKSVERSHDFLVAVLLTIKRKVENGQIIFK